jgi:hypothetical protein
MDSPCPYKRIGAGSFATIYADEGRGGSVIKQVHDPANATVIRKEHDDLSALYDVCKQRTTHFKVPRPFGYYDDCNSFTKVERKLAMYVMQRIWPVPIDTSYRIQDLFFPYEHKQKPPPQFLARLYLGKNPQQRSNRFFSHENFPLDAERIEKLELPADQIAAGMGEMLSIINFRIGRDGRDIEFVLSGDPMNPLSQVPTYSCIDYNQMRPHHGSFAAIVSATAANDPYYPRPSSPYWNNFAFAYISEAIACGREASEIAQQVLDALCDRWADTDGIP